MRRDWDTGTPPLGNDEPDNADWLDWRELPPVDVRDAERRRQADYALGATLRELLRSDLDKDPELAKAARLMLTVGLALAGAQRNGPSFADQFDGDAEAATRSVYRTVVAQAGLSGLPMPNDPLAWQLPWLPLTAILALLGPALGEAPAIHQARIERVSSAFATR